MYISLCSLYTNHWLQKKIPAILSRLHPRLHFPLLHRLHHGRRRLEELPPRELGRRPPYGVGLGAHLPLLRIYRLGLGQAVHDAVEKGPDMSPGPWVNRSWDRLTLPQRLLDVYKRHVWPPGLAFCVSSGQKNAMVFS